MTARRADGPTPRPRPGPVERPVERSDTRPEARTSGRPATSHQPATPRQSAGRGLARRSRRDLPQPGQVAVAAGSAIVTAARVGRLLGRSGWRIARQLPGMHTVEEQAERVRKAAAGELLRLLEVPQQFLGTASPEEQRVMMLVQDADSDPQPLRSAMAELLERSAAGPGPRSRDYLFGTIVSQLVPDEARILAALATGDSVAAVDVVAKQVARGNPRVVLANASTIGAAAGVALPANTPTYLTRLLGFGLLEAGPAPGGVNDQFDAIEADPAVQQARAQVDAGRGRFARKGLTLSALGREFWTACAPTAGSQPATQTLRGPDR